MNPVPRGIPGLLVAAAACLATIAATPASAKDDSIDVQVSQARIIELPEHTATIIIGNPIVADLTLLRGSTKAILTDKGFGETNLIALDQAGNLLGESIIRVKTGFKGLVVQRGLDRESYSCLPRCQPTVVLGDTGKFMGETAGQIQAHASIASGAGGGAK